MSDQNIDKKLRKILREYSYYKHSALEPDIVAQIKQAFADEYHLQPKYVEVDDVEYLPGQEWYDRFEKEYLSLLSPGQMHADDLTEEDVLEAAQRASGINS